MAKETLGPAGGVAAKTAYVFLASTLLVAYTSKAGDVIESLSHGHCSTAMGSAIFDALVAACLVGNVTERTETLSRSVTAMMLALFSGLCSAGIVGLDLSAVAAYADSTHLPAVFPVLVLSLVYHDLIPVICDYLGGDPGR